LVYYVPDQEQVFNRMDTVTVVGDILCRFRCAASGT
jgi:hypothetical protein